MPCCCWRISSPIPWEWGNAETKGLQIWISKATRSVDEMREMRRTGGLCGQECKLASLDEKVFVDQITPRVAAWEETFEDRLAAELLPSYSEQENKHSIKTRHTMSTELAKMLPWLTALSATATLPCWDYPKLFHVIRHSLQVKMQNKWNSEGEMKKKQEKYLGAIRSWDRGLQDRLDWVAYHPVPSWEVSCGSSDRMRELGSRSQPAQTNLFGLFVLLPPLSAPCERIQRPCQVLHRRHFFHHPELDHRQNLAK